MNLNYALALCISTTISATIALIAWRRRAAPGASGLAFLMLSFTVWTLTYAIRWMSSVQTAQYFWLDATYFGAVTVPLFFTVFTLQITHRAHLLTRRNLILLSIEPLITLLLLWTDQGHGLFYGGFRSAGTILNGGPWFWFNVIYSYILNFVMLGLFIQAYRRASHYFRRQAGIILAGVLIPFVGNAISLAGFTPFHDLDLTPILFIVSGLVYAFGLFRYQLMDILPVARDKLIEDMRDGLIMLDVQNRIVDINPAAQKMTGISAGGVGKSAEIAFAAWPGLTEIYNSVVETHTEIYLSQDPPRDVEARVSPLFDPHRNLSGRLIILRDITARKQDEESEKQARILNETLIDSLPGTFYMLDAAGRYVRWNAYQRDEIVGKPESQMAEANALDNIHPDDRAWVSSKIANVLAHGREENVEGRVLLRGGPAFRWFLMTGRQIILNGNPFLIGTGVDITARKQAEELLAKSLERINLAARAASIGIWDWDIQKNELVWDDGMYRLYGVEPDDFAGAYEAWLAGIHPDDREASDEASTQARLSEREYDTEFRIILPNGTIRIIKAYGQVIHDPEGNAIRMTGVNYDITARKQAEIELFEKEVQYRNLADSGVALIWRSGTDKLCSYFNQPWLNFTGRTLELEMGNGWTEGVHPDDFDRCLQTYIAAFDKHEPFDMEYRLHHVSGEYRWLQDLGTPNYNSSGEFIGYIGHCFDISERKRSEEALRESEERHRLLADNASDVIWTMDSDGRFTYISPSVEKLRGFTVAEVMQQTMAESLTPESAVIAQSFFGKALEELRAERPFPGSHVELEQPCKDGSTVWTEVTTSDIHNGAGEFGGILGITRDITERKLSEAAEREQRALAEALRDTAAALNSTLKFDDVLDHILENVGRVVPHNAANIMLLEADGDTVSITRSRGYVERGVENVQAMRFSLAKMPVLSQVMRTGQSLVIPDTHANPAWFDHPSTGWVASYAVAPIRIREHRVGFLNVDSATPGFFKIEHADHLQAFADQAAIAIQNAQLYEEVQQLAITDALTGLFNRRGLAQLGEREVKRALRFKHSLTAVMLDIDHFKLVNDTYGHPIGDRVLRALAECCRAQVRNVDIVARYGGEEFILLLPETDLDSAAQVAERLRQAVENMLVPVAEDEKIVSQTLQVTVSLGVVSLTAETQNLENLLARMDQALYAAKQAGRNRVVIGK